MTRMSHTPMLTPATERLDSHRGPTLPPYASAPAGENSPSGYLVDICRGVAPGCRPFQGCERWERPWGTAFQKVCKHPSSSAFSFRLPTPRAWRCG